MGPWHHGQEIADGSSLGAIKWGSDTALYFRQKILRPFLDHYLKDDAPTMDVAPVTAFETGTNEWRSLKSWATAGNGKPLYLRERLKLSWGMLAGGNPPPAYDEYVSDPTKPVTNRIRPVPTAGYDSCGQWA